MCGYVYAWLCDAWASVDIPIIDSAAIITALLFPLFRLGRTRYYREPAPHILIVFMDLLRGAAFFPFVVLFLGVFSSRVLTLFMSSGARPTLFLAALIGAAAVFKSDRWMMDFLKRPNDGVNPNQANPQP